MKVGSSGIGKPLRHSRNHSVTFASNRPRLCAMRTTVSVNRMAKLLASDAMHRCCQASHQFSKEKSDKEGVVGCKVDL